MLVFTDGACIENGTAGARGGCGIVYGPEGRLSLRLENRGPDGNVYQQTSNRAELRAVIAALQFRGWQGEGFKSVVIATDSTYVVNGATIWVRGWQRNGWMLSSGGPVKNRDLWEALLLSIGKLQSDGVAVSFWKIPRRWNDEADNAAKNAAINEEPVENFRKIMGVMC